MLMDFQRDCRFQETSWFPFVSNISRKFFQLVPHHATTEISGAIYMCIDRHFFLRVTISALLNKRKSWLPKFSLGRNEDLRFKFSK